MNFNEYMDWTDETAIYPTEKGIEYCVLGLTSEAGEVAGKLKKLIRDKEGVVDAMASFDIAKELGDCLWYIARCAKEIDWTLQDIADMNVAKLSERKDKSTLSGSGDNR